MTLIIPTLYIRTNCVGVYENNVPVEAKCENNFFCVSSFAHTYVNILAGLILAINRRRNFIVRRDRLYKLYTLLNINLCKLT